MNWRLLGVIILITGTLLLFAAIGFTIKAVKFRINSTEVTGIIVVSSPRQLVVSVQTKHGKEFIPGNWGRFSWVGREVLVLIPNEDVLPYAKPIVKDNWRLIDEKAVVALALLILGAWLFMKGRTFDI